MDQIQTLDILDDILVKTHNPATFGDKTLTTLGQKMLESFTTKHIGWNIISQI